MAANFGKFSDSEIDFIRDILDEHGDYLRELLEEAIQDKELIQEETLLGSINAKVNPKSDIINPRLDISFMSYGRAIEINFHKKSKNSMLLAMAGNKFRDNRRNKFSKKKDTRWYSRNVYGSLNSLIGKIMFNYQDWVIAKEKAQFRMINKNIPL